MLEYGVELCEDEWIIGFAADGLEAVRPLIMNNNFIIALQRRIANTSIGPSTARGMGPKGTIAAARSFLSQLDLALISNQVEEEFRAWLDQSTVALMEGLPPGGRHWGAARKFLNIYLRGILYNRYLCHAFDLYHIESWLEVPLDSHVARALRDEPGGATLPRWKTVIGLDRSTSDQFQDFAAMIADNKQISRVHLDLLYWRRDA